MKSRNVLFSIFILAIIINFSCKKEESEEIRFYITDSALADGNYIKDFYVVKSPEGSYENWGTSILDGNSNGPYGWEMYKFPPGSYDIKVVYWTGIEKEHTELSKAIANGRGVKYDLDGSNFFRTSFSFETD